MSEINSLWLIELQKVYKKNSDLSIRLYSTDHPLHQSIIRNKERDVRSIHISIHITFTHVVVFVSFQQQHFNEQLTQLTKCLLIWSLIKKISFFFVISTSFFCSNDALYYPKNFTFFYSTFVKVVITLKKILHVIKE